MRHLYVVIDCSRSMEDQDLKPNRLTSTLKVTVAPGGCSDWLVALAELLPRLCS